MPILRNALSIAVELHKSSHYPGEMIDHFMNQADGFACNGPKTETQVCRA